MPSYGGYILDNGRNYNFTEVARMCADADIDELGWQHIVFIATMYAESGFYEWIRPIVVDPGAKHHLSVDRGICQLNSYWWGDIPDSIAYDSPAAIGASIARIKGYVADGVRGSRPWKWSPILDWQWHAYGSPGYYQALGPARQAVNEIRAEDGLGPI